MRYDLIWKQIDSEITQEEKTLMVDLLTDEGFKKEYDRAIGLDNALRSHLNVAIDPSFISKLKRTINAELQIPSMSFSYTPVLVFVIVSILVLLGYSSTHQVSTSLDIEGNLAYVSYSVFIVIALFLLFVLDQLMNSRLSTTKPKK